MWVTSLGLAGEAGIFASLPFYPMFSGVPNGPLRLSPPQVHAAVHNSGVTKIVDALSKLIELFDPKTLTKTQRFTVIYTLVQIGSLVFVLEFVDLGAHRDALVAFIVVATYFLMTWVLLLCFSPDFHFSFGSANHRVTSDAFIYAG